MDVPEVVAPAPERRQSPELCQRVIYTHVGRRTHRSAHASKDGVFLCHPSGTAVPAVLYLRLPVFRHPSVRGAPGGHGGLGGGGEGGGEGGGGEGGGEGGGGEDVAAYAYSSWMLSVRLVPGSSRTTYRPVAEHSRTTSAALPASPAAHKTPPVGAPGALATQIWY